MRLRVKRPLARAAPVAPQIEGTVDAWTIVTPDGFNPATLVMTDGVRSVLLVALRDGGIRRCVVNEL